MSHNPGINVRPRASMISAFFGRLTLPSGPTFPIRLPSTMTVVCGRNLPVSLSNKFAFVNAIGIFKSKFPDAVRPNDGSLRPCRLTQHKDGISRRLLSENRKPAGTHAKGETSYEADGFSHDKFSCFQTERVRE